jgi:hypothetical protein
MLTLNETSIGRLDSNARSVYSGSVERYVRATTNIELSL